MNVELAGSPRRGRGGACWLAAPRTVCVCVRGLVVGQQRDDTKRIDGGAVSGTWRECSSRATRGGAEGIKQEERVSSVSESMYELGLKAGRRESAAGCLAYPGWLHLPGWALEAS